MDNLSLDTCVRNVYLMTYSALLFVIVLNAECQSFRFILGVIESLLVSWRIKPFKPAVGRTGRDMEGQITMRLHQWSQ